MLKKLIFAFLLYILFFYAVHAKNNEQQVNLYAWYEFIPKEILQRFEHETGIEVHIDYYDSNQTLETALLTRNTGYDVVFPSAYPYMARGVKNDLYQRFDKSKLPNLKHLDPDIVKFLETADPGHDYAIAYIWGITGIAYNRKWVQEVLPNAPLDSWAMLYKREIVKQLTPFGVYILDEPVEVFTTALAYLGYDPYTQNATERREAYDLLKTVRPFIRRFESMRGHQDLINGEAILIQSWSGDISLARQYARAAGRTIDIGFSVPKEGSSIFIDVVTIPKNAPNLDNAHRFINFLMRPDIIAIATNQLGYSNANVDALPYIDAEIRNDPLIFPDKSVLKRLFISTFSTRTQEQQTNRLMMRLKANR